MSGKKAAALAAKVAELERKLMEAKAHYVHNYRIADAALDNASTRHMKASSVIITITALGGRVIVEPTAILNGLGDETIAALKADMVRSFEYATELKPKGAK